MMPPSGSHGLSCSAETQDRHAFLKRRARGLLGWTRLACRGTLRLISRTHAPRLLTCIPRSGRALHPHPAARLISRCSACPFFPNCAAFPFFNTFFLHLVCGRCFGTFSAPGGRTLCGASALSLRRHPPG